MTPPSKQKKRATDEKHECMSVHGAVSFQTTQRANHHRHLMAFERQ